MMNSWSGGQFSIFRFCLGAATAGVFAVHAAQGGWALVLGAPMVAVAAAFAVGWYDKLAAVLLVFACLIGLKDGPEWVGHIALGLLFLFHIIKSPPAPFGSVAAAGRLDPGGNWKLPPDFIPGAAALYGALAIANCFLWLTSEPAFQGSVGKFTIGALDVLLFALLVTASFVYARTQSRIGWLTLLVVTGLLGLTVGSYGATLGHALFLFLLFQPGWIPPRRYSGGTQMVFFDGECGLCHMSVRLLLAEDRNDAFRYAPLRGETYHETFTPEQQRRLPDSVLVPLSKGRVLTKSAAALYAFSRLGGLWRLIAEALMILPRPITDLGYTLVAHARNILFKRPSQTCPLVPERLRKKMKA